MIPPASNHLSASERRADEDADADETDHDPGNRERGRRTPRKTRPSTATHSGIIAISRAATPEGSLPAERDHPHAPTMRAAR